MLLLIIAGCTCIVNSFFQILSKKFANRCGATDRGAAITCRRAALVPSDGANGAPWVCGCPGAVGALCAACVICAGCAWC